MVQNLGTNPTSSGDEINKDLNNMQETTKDKDSGYYNTFVESGVLVLATEKGREDFKESMQLAGEEVAAVGRVVDTVINKQEEDKRDPLTVLGEERQAEKWRNEGLVEDFKNAKSQEEMAEAIEKIGAKEGYEVEVIYSDSSNGKLLDGKEGNAWYDDETGKITILINTEAEGIGNKDKLAGVLAEELSHGINEANGKNKGSGTETLAGHSNDYFTGKLGDSSTSISLTGDGKDYSNVDFGELIGDKKIADPKALKNNYAPEDINKQKYLQAFQEAYGKSYIVDWGKYEKDEGYRRKINYYYLEALNFVKDVKELKQGDFILVPPKESIYHNYNYSEKNFNILEENSNKKYTSFETGKEGITTPNGQKLVKDPVVAGTFNFFTYTPEDTTHKSAHVADIQTWIQWGSGINDYTTMQERIDIFGMGTYISLNYDSIQKWAKANNISKVGKNELLQYNKDSFTKFWTDYQKNAKLDDYIKYREYY